MKNVDIFPAEKIKRELNEDISRRTLNSKTYSLGNNKYKLTQSMGVVHYQDNDEFKEIDLTFIEEDDCFYMDKAPYKLKIFKDFIGYQYISKRGGRVDVKLKEIDGKDISELDLNIKLEKIKDNDNRVIYKDVLPGVDLFLILKSGKVQFFKTLHYESAANSFTWDVYEDEKTNAHFVRKTLGEDKNKNQIELTNDIKEIKTDKGYKHLIFKEKFNGRISKKDKKTRIKFWSDDVTYPVIIDADITEDIVDTDDDGFEINGYWINGYSSVDAVGAVGVTSSSVFYSIGTRFRSVAIPQGVTIDTGTVLKVKVTSYDSGLTAKIYGDDVDDAALWSSSDKPSGITKTTASATFKPSSEGVMSIDVKSIVQEIINRPGWSSGNDIRFGMFEDSHTGTGSFTSIIMIADYDDSQLNAAHLEINYTEAGNRLTASVTAYSVTSLNTVLVKALHLVGSVSSYVVTAKNAILNKGKLLVASVTTYTVTGVNALFNAVLSLPTAVAEYTVTGVNAIITFSNVVVNHILETSVVNYVVTTLSSNIKNYVTPKLTPFGYINGIEIPTPSKLTERNEIIGDYKTTLKGKNNRYIKNVKKTWILGYDILSVEQYDSIYNEFEKSDPNKFDEIEGYAEVSITKLEMAINNEQVFITLSPRILIPGTDNLSSVEITLTQV